MRIMGVALLYRIVFHPIDHALPNAFPMPTTAALGFIGLGTQPTTPDRGAAIARERPEVIERDVTTGRHGR